MTETPQEELARLNEQVARGYDHPDVRNRIFRLKGIVKGRETQARICNDIRELLGKNCNHCNPRSDSLCEVCWCRYCEQTPDSCDYDCKNKPPSLITTVSVV